MRVSQDVLEVLDRSRTDGPNLYLPPGQLDRKLYEAVNKALVCAGGKWTRGVQAHVFACPAEEAIEPILLTGEITDAKKELQAFYTPLALAEQVVEEAEIRPGMKVLEPSAGEGVLGRQAIDAGGEVTAVEINAGLREHLEFTFGGFVVLDDFLNTDVDQLGGPFDRVVMNPPFTKQADARHVLHAAKMLKPGGRLVAIMAASVTFRDTPLYREVRDLVVANGGTIEPLPEGSFKESGTGVNTVLVSFTLQEGFVTAGEALPASTLAQVGAAA